MAYRAEIQIGVVGIGQIGTLEKSLKQVSNAVDVINAKQIKAGFNIQNINTYNAQLEKAWQNINRAAMGSKEELKAVQDLVTAKNNQIAAQERLNRLLIQEEATQRKIVATADAGFGVQGPEPAKGGLGFNPKATAENLALGAGFPLLFGGGAGQVAGGLAGSFFGQGFGGQILGSAIGQQLEDAQRRISEIGIATKDLNMDALRDSAITVNAELTNQVRLLQEAGNADAARAAIADQVTLQTGLLPGAVQDITNNVGLLGNTWNEFLGAVSGTLSIIGAPFVSALTAILQGLAKALQLVNFIATALGGWLKSGIEFVAKFVGLGGLLDGLKSKTTAISEEEQKRIAALQQLTDKQVIEIQNNKKLLDLETQRTLGRSIAEKEINLQVGKQIASEKIRAEYAEKAKQLRLEYAGVTSEAGKRELDLALQANSALEKQALTQQKIKDSLAEQQLQIETNTEKYNQAAEAVNRQIQALDRGNQVTQSRYSAEAALNDLYGAQLQRQDEIATTEEQRFEIALQMFQQQIRAAKIQYEQALNNNALLIEKAKLEASLVEIKYKQLEAEKAIAIAQAQSRGNTPEQIQSIANAYDKGLGLQKEAVQAAYDQVQATAEIAANQNRVAEAVFQTKIIQAESQLAQKLTSEEIGMSKESADRLAGALAVGVLETRRLGGAMNDVAASAHNAAVNITRAFYAQLQFNAARGNAGGAPEGAAAGAYWQGGFKAFADGGVVTKPTLGMIGEGGEPEYVIPASKMSEAMQRYAAGQRGSSVIPTSVNPQVNVTTGPVMNMNGTNYVSQSDFLNGMQTASRRGAEMAIEMLQFNNNTRRMAGIV